MPKGSSLASKRFCGRFHQIFTEVTSRFHEGCASFVISLVFWSRSLSFPKGFCGQFPPSLFYISLSVASTHFCIFLNCVSFWVFSHNKGLGEIDTFVFWSSLRKWLSPPKRFFGVFPKLFCTFFSESPAVFRVNGCCFRKGSMRVPPTILYICLPNGCCFIKSSLESSANCALHLSPSLLLGSKLRELLTCLNHNHTNPVHRNRPIMLLLLGYSLGLVF